MKTSAQAKSGASLRRQAAQVSVIEADGPASARMTPQMRLNSVVFPAPFGPMIACRSPAGNQRDRTHDGNAAKGLLRP